MAVRFCLRLRDALKLRLDLCAIAVHARQFTRLDAARHIGFEHGQTFQRGGDLIHFRCGGARLPVAFAHFAGHPQPRHRQIGIVGAAFGIDGRLEPVFLTRQPQRQAQFTRETAGTQIAVDLISFMRQGNRRRRGQQRFGRRAPRVECVNPRLRSLRLRLALPCRFHRLLQARRSGCRCSGHA